MKWKEFFKIVGKGFSPATFKHVNITSAIFFTCLWVVITAPNLVYKQWWILPFDLWMLGNWIVLLGKLVKKRRGNADWTTAPEDIHRACRAAGFSEATAKSIIARASARTYASGRSAIGARYNARRAREGSRRGTRSGIVLGIKEVSVNGGLLRSTQGDYLWSAGENVAGCVNDPEHFGPVDDCSCGLYAYNAEYSCIPGLLMFEDGLRTYSAVLVLELYGKIEVCEYGYRAEKARILAVGVNQSQFAKRLLQMNYPELSIEVLS